MKLQHKFLQCVDLLRADAHLWRPNPFLDSNLEWTKHHPDLYQACVQLDEDQLHTLEDSPEALLDWLAHYLTSVAAIRHLTNLDFSKQRPVKWSSHWDVGIPGRKAEQIQAFAHSIQRQGKHWVDWCSGKAHLGRNMAQIHQCGCVAVEYNQQLCQQGEAIAAKQQVDVTYKHANVITDDIALDPESHVLALHACGDLHRTLINQICQQKVAALSLAPCCYPLWIKQHFTPLSQLAQKHDLALTRHDLHLAVQESVTASKREQKLSSTMAAWRLGFDQLQRDIRGVDQYLTTPSMPLSILKQGFEQFCRQLAQKKQFDLPQDIDWQDYQQQGERRWQRARRLQLVRHAYRRPLELWLVLDLALKLEESGYQVALSEFCDRNLTPRNLLINAQQA